MLQAKSELAYDNLNPVVDFLGAGVSNNSQILHTHKFYELHYCLSGSGYFKVNDQVYTMKTGDMIFCAPNEIHGCIGSDDYGLELFYVAFHDFYSQEENMQNFPIRESAERIVHTALNTRQKLNACYMEMMDEYSMQLPGYAYMLKENLVRMIILMMRETFQTMMPCVNSSAALLKVQKTKIIKEIIEYLNSNYTSKISLDHIAKNVFMTPSYICKIFKQETGESPINYLIRLRMEKACHLLMTEKEYTIKEIACMVGYEDIYQFSKLFKKYYGMAPSYYRSQVG